MVIALHHVLPLRSDLYSQTSTPRPLLPDIYFQTSNPRPLLSDLYSQISTLRSLLSDLYSQTSTPRPLLADLYSQISTLRSLLSDLYSQTSTPRPLLSDLYSQTSTHLYSQTSTLRPLLSDLYSQTSTLRSLLSDLYSQTSTPRPLLSDLYSQISTLRPLLPDLYSQISTLRPLLSDLYSQTSTPRPLLPDLFSLTSTLRPLLPDLYSQTSTLRPLLSDLYSPNSTLRPLFQLCPHWGLHVTATDADGGSFGSISYSLGSGINSAVPSQFSVGKETGQICTNVALDRDQGPTSYDFTVTAVDGGGLNSVAYVRVDLLDINDNRPVFYPVSYAVSLSSQSAPGTSVVKVTALDPDTGENGRVTYRTVPRGNSPFFTLNKDTGVISLSRSLHGKANTVIPMVVSAQDGGGLAALVNARVNISVVAGLVAPPVFEHSQYSFTVCENVLRGTEVGIVQAISKNGGPSKDILYTISSGDPAGYFTVDPESGALRTSLPLDHEAQPSLTLELQARSGSPPAFGQTHVHITIQDINDNAPVFMPSSSESLLLPEHTEIGTVVYRVQAKDRDSGLNGQMTFDLSSTATSSGGQRTFSMERSTGEIRLVGGLSYDLKMAARRS
ncbi:protocadherin-16-like [Oncorhynchus masou masou]|uniref:protocadherin-16-like n=1 Tax=Oncorhynchus masou masou TaxID=90313 RepID=UPI0031841482